MEIANNLINFFGINLLTESATFIDLLNVMMRIGISVWIVVFIIRSMFLVASVGGRRFY